MASKYIQRFPVPNDFEIILNDFAKEVLRAQPDDIIQFATEYFEFKSKNPNQNFPSSSESLKYNIAKKAEPKEYNATPYDQLQGQNLRKNEFNSQNENYESQEANSYKQENQEQNQPDPYNENDENNQNNSQSQERNVSSKQSQRSYKTQTTHPEEKQVTKDFINNLYDSAVQQTAQQGSEQQQQQEQDNQIQLDGPIEEYEQAARLIQANFRNKKPKQ